MYIHTYITHHHQAKHGGNCIANMRLYAVPSFVSADICACYNCPRNCAAVSFRGGTHGKASRQHAAGWQGRRASGPPASQAAPDRDELPAHPIPSPGQKSQGGSRQLFRDVTALGCPGSSVRLGRGLQHLEPTTQSSNPCSAWRGPIQSLGAQAPSAFITLVRSFDPIHPSSLPSSSLPDGLGRAKQSVTGHGGLDLVQCRITHR